MKLARIVVVDDDSGVLRSVERVLGRKYEVASTGSPQEAIQLTEDFEPDLAILDIRMPGMDGFELMGRLKSVRSDLDIILMTGSIHELDTQLIRAIREKAFYFLQKPFDREVLLTLVERCLELRKLDRQNRFHLMRVEKELSEARAFQRSLLPAEQGCVGGLAVFARYIPCSELGGDFYDYAEAGPTCATLIVADVSGHGVMAAMLTGIVKSAFHSASGAGYAPLEIVERISTGLQAFSVEQFVTVLCVRSSSAGAILEYVNAGHPPGILWRAGCPPTFLEATGPLISPAFPNFSWVQERLPTGERNQLLLFTDGIPEIEGDDGFLGLERLVREVKNDQKGGPELLDQILRSAREFSGGRRLQDDLTLLTANLSIGAVAKSSRGTKPAET
jgi:sigma-B regulation protein RsbU (phosphoserine phosphatase)